VETVTAFLEQRRSDLSSLTSAEGARGSVRAGHDSSYHELFYRRLDVSWTRRPSVLPRRRFDDFRKSAAAGLALRAWTFRQQRHIR
jgi:hypothetical protein